MHDVIAKTLPASLALLAVQREAAADIEAKTAARQDSAMIERDLSRGAQPPAPAVEDPLTAVEAAIDDLIEFACEDAINAGSFNPRLQGPNEPDVSGMNRRVKAVLDEVRKLMRQPEPKPVQAPATDNGLLTTHNPDRRGAAVMTDESGAAFHQAQESRDA